jgi:hypothetical protein
MPGRRNLNLFAAGGNLRLATGQSRAGNSRAPRCVKRP